MTSPSVLTAPPEQEDHDPQEQWPPGAGSPADGPSARTPPSAVRRWIRILIPVAVVSVAIWTLRDSLPAPAQIAHAMREASTWGLAVALATSVLSVTMFARQQRALLHAYGAAMRMPHALALAYARTAIAAALPAGSAVSAAYAFQRFRAHGASRTTAASVTILSGTVSAIGLLLLYLAGTALALVIDPALLVDAQGTLITGGALILLAGAILLAGRLRRPRPTSRWSRVATFLAPVGTTFRTVAALPRRDAAAALCFAVVGWLADLACLYTATVAFDLDVHPVRLAAVYLATQLLRQIPLTPGGIGIIETSLIAGLTATGAPVTPVTAAVLVYRLLTCWLTLPVGAAAWALLRRIEPSPQQAPEPQPVS
ncbi:lysylphosphatidylglycerol synthase transmembrane domain-containing protein [Streptosporangium lutulentum]|uniref:Uncharacterized membrane protein YbhN (UPF0104 family) n=1 Tax=Streptosporangium lutulentum TaxID=1461250 RepID=A0ABT9QNK0_9ACTN|nr:YbhN family protein [Streptosporangium lutulentum]MDP9847594.1 uncharacterized membrane protein YbhN (UPF0104 family) [Streptosporangium lutulentum]